ncbi:alpha/beta-hydrolase [Dentipellis sp. KUC8613]|nr:alpha/beta-hydrolase [Dentipellis sp. KUC8613]
MRLSLPAHALVASILSLVYTPLASAAPTDIPSAASFYVPTLPDLHQDETHPLHIFAGHLSADPEAKNLPATTVSSQLYFVLIKARRTADKERILFWFNGGPGCSSFDGLMMEVGPWRVDGQGGLHTIEGGWEEYTTIVYVDQPAGTGFSYTSTDRFVHELGEASSQLLEFLRNFYLVFPEYKRMDTYLGGESFAGQYIPYFSDAILNSTLGINLRGAAIGNGWIDARRQYPSFLDYAVKHGIIEEGTDWYSKGKAAVDACLDALKNVEGEPVRVDICEDVMGAVSAVRNRNVKGEEVCMNVYDVRLDDIQPACGMNWPPDLKNVTTYLRRPDVVQSLNANGKSESWTECQSQVSRELWLHDSPSAITVLPRVTERIPVLIFAGDQDFICNYLGLESMIQAMSWGGATGLGEVETQTWTVDGQPAGTWVSSRNLTYAKIFNASHMVGFDVPHVSHDMILRFMGMNFSAITDGSARIPSSVGGDNKPAFDDATPSGTPAPVGKTPEQNKAMWEAYYNAGSAALILVLIALAIGVFLWCRIRRRRLRGLPIANNEEESIPLTRSTHDLGQNGNTEDDSSFRGRKGKERAHEPEPERIFDVGDSDDEGNGHAR